MTSHTAAVAYEWIYFGAIIVTLVIAFRMLP